MLKYTFHRSLSKIWDRLRKFNNKNENKLYENNKMVVAYPSIGESYMEKYIRKWRKKAKRIPRFPAQKFIVN